LPYVVTTDARLFRFDPTDLRFSIAGWLSCAIVPSSMAIDKTGQAWVHSKDDRFFKVDPATLHCKEVYLHRSGADASRYGLGFAEDPAGGPETLYAAGKNGLGTIDVRSLVLTPKESWSKGLVGPAELAGQGTTLYALFVTGSSHVLGIVDPLNGTLTKTLPITLGTFRAYAMAAWHESLWLFTNGDVHRYDLETGTTTLVVENAGFEVVGAGSTACVLAP
jgi:streptogramin lyase